MNKEIINELVLANRILSNEGILDGLGHISVRNAENQKTFFIAAAVPPLFVNEDDILEVDFEGNVLHRSGKRPVSERFLHASIYKERDDINTVFHGHHPLLVVFSITGIPLLPVCHVGSFLYQGVPVFHNYERGSGMLINTQEEGEKIQKCLGEKRALLMRAHGYVVVGETLRRTVASAIYMVTNAEIQLKALSIGREPEYLSYEEAKDAMEKALFSDSPLSRMWGYWAGRIKKH